MSTALLDWLERQGWVAGFDQRGLARSYRIEHERGARLLAELVAELESDRASEANARRGSIARRASVPELDLVHVFEAER